jgi:SAM-dependent methyltransferase
MMATSKNKTDKTEALIKARQEYLEAHEGDDATIDFAKPAAEIETTRSSFDVPEEPLSVAVPYPKEGVPLGNAIGYVDIEVAPPPTVAEIEKLIEEDGRDEGVIDFGKMGSIHFSRKSDFIYNCLASIEGYNGFGVSYRKGWEIEMALKTLHDLGGAHPNANILGVGAGTERTIFELANAQSAALVTPTDIYLTPGVWADWHGEKFMKNPHAFAPEGLPYDPARIIPMHVDMCDMPYEDEVYDGIFSSGSIEHVGYPKTASWELVAKAAKEIGRVLKKGGIASISTEFKVSGEGWGFEGVRLFSKEDILKYIVEPSGLELVGEVDWEYRGDLEDYVELADAVRNPQAEENKPLLRHGGFLFTSLHLALKKA